MAIRSVSYQERIKELERVEQKRDLAILGLERRLSAATEAEAKAMAEVASLNAAVKKLSNELAEAKGAVTLADKAIARTMAEMAALREAAVQPKPDAAAVKAEGTAPEAAAPPATTDAA